MGVVTTLRSGRLNSLWDPKAGRAGRRSGSAASIPTYAEFEAFIATQGTAGDGTNLASSEYGTKVIAPTDSGSMAGSSYRAFFRDSSFMNRVIQHAFSTGFDFAAYVAAGRKVLITTTSVGEVADNLVGQTRNGYSSSNYGGPNDCAYVPFMAWYDPVLGPVYWNPYGIAPITAYPLV